MGHNPTQSRISPLNRDPVEMFYVFPLFCITIIFFFEHKNNNNNNN